MIYPVLMNRRCQPYCRVQQLHNNALLYSSVAAAQRSSPPLNSVHKITSKHAFKNMPVALLTFILLGPIADSDSAYCDRCCCVAWSVRLSVCMSVCLSHSCILLKLLDGMRCHLATFVSPKENLGAETPSSQRCHLSSNYFGVCQTL